MSEKQDDGDALEEKEEEKFNQGAWMEEDDSYYEHKEIKDGGEDHSTRFVLWQSIADNGHQYDVWVQYTDNEAEITRVSEHMSKSRFRNVKIQLEKSLSEHEVDSIIENVKHRMLTITKVRGSFLPPDRLDIHKNTNLFYFVNMVEFFVESKSVPSKLGICPRAPPPSPVGPISIRPSKLHSSLLISSLSLITLVPSSSDLS